MKRAAIPVYLQKNSSSSNLCSYVSSSVHSGSVARLRHGHPQESGGCDSTRRGHL